MLKSQIIKFRLILIATLSAPGFRKEEEMERRWNRKIVGEASYSLSIK